MLMESVALKLEMRQGAQYFPVLPKTQASQAATPVEQPKAVAAPKPAPDPKVRQHSLWLIPFISQRLYFWRSVHIQYIFHISNICMQLYVCNISMHIYRIYGSFLFKFIYSTYAYAY